MDTLKFFQSAIKDVFHHIHSFENRTAPSIRMSEILNISQISQDSEQKSNNSINSRILKAKIKKEKQKFLDELLVVKDPEATIDGINQKSDYKLFHDISKQHNSVNQLTHSNEGTKNHEHDLCSQMDLDGKGDNHISKTSQNHDVFKKLVELLEKNESQGIELSLEEKLSKKSIGAFEVLNNDHDIPENTESSESSNVEKRPIRCGKNCSVSNHTAVRIENVETAKYYGAMLQNSMIINNNQQSYRRSANGWVDVHHTENDVNVGCSKEEGEEEEEMVLSGDITTSSGLNIATSRLKDNEEEYHQSCAARVTSKRISDKETYSHLPSTKSNRNKNVPVMGKAALLQKASIDNTDCLIIQDLILTKYSKKIRQYLERNHKRRETRYENFEEYLTSCQYTPSSISSLDYLNSFDGYDQKVEPTFSSIERDNMETNITNSMTSTPFVQNTTNSYSMNDIISKNSRISYTSISEPDLRVNGYSTKLISQEGEEMFLQESGVDGSESEKCMQCLECYSTISYERQNSNEAQPNTDNANWISYENMDVKNSDKNVSFMESADDLDIQHPANTSSSTYSVSKFIENALGSVNLAQENVNNNDTNGSGLYQNINCTSIYESISTSKISDLLSKGSADTNCLTRRRQLVRADSLYEIEIPPENHMELELLTTQLSIQNQTLLQASKAVKHCRANGILHTTGYIEAEKVLLLASETKKALNEDIHYIESKKYFNKDDSTLNTGQIDLNNIVLEWNTSNRQNDKHLEVFLVLIKCGSQVYGSRVLLSKKSKFIFQTSITLERLTADFKICIELYSMAVNLQKPHHFSCITSMDIFANRRPKTSIFIDEDASLDVTSAFTLAGKCDIGISDLTKTDGTGKLMVKLQKVSKDCTIPDKICLNVQSKLKLNSCLKGFLTIGTKNEHSCIIWNRRWCMLKGSTVLYWNHPSEEEFAPNGSINLVDCTENYIVIAERHLCSRPRTLMLPIKEGEYLKRYFLSTDDNIELDTWDKQLNLTIRALKVWRNSEIC